MDNMKLHKGEPANFLDVGGTVNEEQVLQTFQLLTRDPQVIPVRGLGEILPVTTLIVSGWGGGVKIINVLVHAKIGWEIERRDVMDPNKG